MVTKVLLSAIQWKLGLTPVSQSLVCATGLTYGYTLFSEG